MEKQTELKELFQSLVIDEVFEAFIEFEIVKLIAKESKTFKPDSNEYKLIGYIQQNAINMFFLKVYNCTHPKQDGFYTIIKKSKIEGLAKAELEKLLDYPRKTEIKTIRDKHIAHNDKNKYTINITFNELEEVLNKLIKAIDILTPYIIDSTPYSQAIIRDGKKHTFFIKKLIKDLKKNIK